MMTYDKYKTATDRDEYSDMLTECCGCEQQSTMIDDELISCCYECGEAYPTMITEEDYQEKMKEWYAEFQEDEKRDLR
tara:strand:+ start:190 stop:423 length:234 start_codon:yes stop_codon:yes gene_type:complete